MRFTKKENKNIIGSILFTTFGLTLLFLISYLVKPPMGEYVQVQEFYQLPKQSLDYVAIGSSHAYCTFNPVLLEKDTGKKSFAFSTAALSFPGRLCYLKEMYKTQSPRIVFMDMTGADLDDAVFEKHRHENFSYLPMNLNRYLYAFESVNSRLWEEMVFPLKLYHSNYADINRETVVYLIKNKPIGARGYVRLKDAHPITRASDNPQANVVISQTKLTVLDDIVKETKKHGTRLVFFAAPSSMANQAAYMNVLKKRYSGQDILYLNMNDWVEASGLSEKEDFYDSNHLNELGVNKITPFIERYVEEIGK